MHTLTDQQKYENYMELYQAKYKKYKNLEGELNSLIVKINNLKQKIEENPSDTNNSYIETEEITKIF